MKTKLIIAIAALIAIAGIAAYVFRDRAATKSADKEVKQQKAADIYYCPMHPTVTSDHPGNCPICGMALVKREVAPAASQLANSGSLDAVSLSPEQRVTANVKTMRVESATGTGDLVTTGRVTFDERRLAQVTAYTAGRIERLYANFTGDSIRRGDTVATMYSPDLFGTQQEYLLALSNNERMRRAGFADARSAASDLVESTRRRLMLFGMTEGQIRQLERSGKPLYTTNIVSSVSGIVTKKYVVPQQYVAQGQPLLDVADLSTVWVEADVYEQQLPNIAIGQKVVITAPALNAEMTGTVGFIQPVLAGDTRTAQVRIELPNPRLQLKPDMYVTVRIFGVPAPEHIMLPASAIVDRGQKQFVWVETQPGAYEPREVKTGARHGEQIVIVSGINAGDTIVLEGGFLLDSEAQLRSATAGGHEH